MTKAAQAHVGAEMLDQPDTLPTRLQRRTWAIHAPDMLCNFLEGLQD